MRKPDIWKNIKGYNGKYQVSYAGEIRRVYPSGKTRLLTPHKHCNLRYSRNTLFVKLTDHNGKGREIPVIRIVAQTFLPEPPPGYVAYHKNGVLADNWASNIGYISRHELGKKTGHISRSKAVVKIDQDGQFVAFYKSARDAAKENFMSRQTVTDRCNGYYRKKGVMHPMKSVFAPDGYAYSWDDDKSIQLTLDVMQGKAKYKKPRRKKIKTGADGQGDEIMCPDQANADWLDVEGVAR